MSRMGSTTEAFVVLSQTTPPAAKYRFSDGRHLRPPPPPCDESGQPSRLTNHKSSVCPSTLSLEGNFEGSRVAMRHLFFKFDDACAVINADGAKLAKDILAQEAVERGAEPLGEIAKIHDRHGLRKHEAASEFEVYPDTEGITNNADLAAGRLKWEQEASAVAFDVEDGVVRAGVEQQRDRLAIHPGVDQKHGVRGTKREKNRSGAGNDGRRKEQRKRRKNHRQGTDPIMERKVQPSTPPKIARPPLFRNAGNLASNRKYRSAPSESIRLTPLNSLRRRSPRMPKSKSQSGCAR